MTKETTTTTIMLLEADNRAAHHTRRTDAAHARHAVNTNGVWTATPNGIRPPIHRQNGEQLQATADSAAFLAIRARHQAAATDLFRQLTSARHSDRTAASIATIGNAAIEAERERDEQRKTAAYHRSQAERKTITPKEAKAHREKARAATRAADKAAAKADSLNKLIKQSVSSDRADIVQAAIIAALTYDHAADPNGAFKAMCAAAGKAIAAVASPTALTATRTKVKEITPAEAAEMLRTYPNIVTIDPVTGYEIETPCKIPHNVKGTTSQCYDTIEQRQRGREKRLVWCIVSHYLTVAPYISYEAFTEASGGDTAEIATNGGINAIGTQEDAAAIAQLLSDANLTERETLIVYRTADQTAALHGQYAATEYWTRRTPEINALATPKARREAFKDAQKTADRERIAAQWANALDRTGIYSESNRTTIKGRIKKKLTEAQKPAEPMTEADRRKWKQLQGNSRRGHATEPSRRPDAIAIVCPAAVLTAAVLEMTAPAQWTYRAAKSAADSATAFSKYKPVIKWTDSGNEPQTIGGDYRAAEVIKRDSGRVNAPKATPPALTSTERAKREKLCRREAELFALWAEFEKLTGRHPAENYKLPQADTTTPAAEAERQRMRAAAAGLNKIKDRYPRTESPPIMAGILFIYSTVKP